MITIKDNRELNEEVWIVTYWDKGEEPTVTPFFNEEAANKAYNYFKSEHEGCCIDKCKIYNSFNAF